ncbi:MAG: hypothetical protein RR527_06810, partial [Clostridia bacterium]
MLAADILIGWSVTSTIQGVLACEIAMLGDQLYKQAQLGLHENKLKSKKKVNIDRYRVLIIQSPMGNYLHMNGRGGVGRFTYAAPGLAQQFLLIDSR